MEQRRARRCNALRDLFLPPNQPFHKIDKASSSQCFRTKTSHKGPLSIYFLCKVAESWIVPGIQFKLLCRLQSEEWCVGLNHLHTSVDAAKQRNIIFTLILMIEFSIILTQQNDFLFQANDQAAVAQPTMSRLLLQLIQDGHPAPGFCDEDILLESPEDTGLDVIASAEAIRRLAQTPQDQAVMNSEEQVFRTRFLVT